MPELIEKRTRSSKTHSLGGRKFAWDGTIGSIHYEDNGWQNIDNEFLPIPAPWDWQMLKAGYHIRVKEDFTAGQIIEFEVQGETVQLQPMALEWTNDLDQIQQVSMPQSVTPVVTNPEVDLLPVVGMPSHQGTIRWDDAYGQGIDFQWRCTSARLTKILEIESLNKLPIPQQYILDGGNPVLRLSLIFDPPNKQNVDIIVDGQVWNQSSKAQTFRAIEFRKDGEVLWGFMPILYWDSGDGVGQSVATVEKRGNKLYISIRVPYSWLQTAIYPVFIDTTIDEQIGATADDAYQSVGSSNTPGSAAVFFRSITWLGVRFSGVSGISLGDTIDVAYASLYARSTDFDDPDGKLYFEEVASPTDFASGATRIEDRSKTTAFTSWVASGVGTGFKDTPSLVTPLQEAVDSNAPTYLALEILGNSSSIFSIWAWDFDTALSSKLHVEYTAAAGGWAGEYCGVAVDEFDGVTPDEIDGV